MAWTSHPPWRYIGVECQLPVFKNIANQVEDDGTFDLDELISWFSTKTDFEKFYNIFEVDTNMDGRFSSDELESVAQHLYDAYSDDANNFFLWAEDGLSRSQLSSFALIGAALEWVSLLPISHGLKKSSDRLLN